MEQIAFKEGNGTLCYSESSGFYEPESSLLFSQKTSTGLHLEPDQANQYAPSILPKHPNYK
jgi:hypothetical protein